jgi:hypothetical protein
MSGNFQIVYPPRYYTALDGGLNVKIPKAWILDNESPDCLNVEFGNGDCFTRGGTSKLNTAAVGSMPCDGLFVRHTNSGAESMTAWFGGTLYTLAGTAFSAVPSAASAFTANTRVYSAEYEEFIFFGNGASIPYKYANGGFTRHGIYPPTTTMSVASHSSGGSALSGQYQWAVTNVNSNLVESDLSPFTVKFYLAGTAALLTSVPVAPTSFGVAARIIYRNASSGTTWYQVGSIADNTTTTFTDNVSDLVAIAGDEAPTDNGVPPKYSDIKYHADRLFMIDPTTNWVWYTEIGNPFIVKTTNFLRAGNQTADIPIGLGIYDNFLIIKCRNSDTLVYMPSADDTEWVTQSIRSPYGTLSPFSIVNVENRLMFGAVDRGKFVGFGMLSAEGMDQVASVSTVGAIGGDLYSQNIEYQMFQVNTGKLEDVSSIVFKNKVYIALAYGSSNINNRIYVFDFSNSRLTKDQKYTWAPWTGLYPRCFCNYDGKLYYGTSQSTGFIYEMNTSTYNDDGTAIDSYVWSKEYSGLPGHESNHKDWRFLNLLYELVGAWKMGLTIRVDSDKGVGTSQDIDCTPGSSLWGTMVWGVDNWEPGKNDKDLKLPLGGFFGKRVQFKFSNKNQVNQNFRAIGLSLTYNLKSRR